MKKIYLLIAFLILIVSCKNDNSVSQIQNQDSLEYYFEVSYQGKDYCNNCQVWLNTVYRGELNYEGETKKFKAENGMNTYKLRYGNTDFINYFMLNPENKFYKMNLKCP